MVLLCVLDTTNLRGCWHSVVDGDVTYSQQNFEWSDGRWGSACSMTVQAEGEPPAKHPDDDREHNPVRFHARSASAPPGL